MATGPRELRGGPNEQHLGQLFNRAADAFTRSAELAEARAGVRELEGDLEVAEAESH